jgi:hypothetical protein
MPRGGVRGSVLGAELEFQDEERFGGKKKPRRSGFDFAI